MSGNWGEVVVGTVNSDLEVRLSQRSLSPLIKTRQFSKWVSGDLLRQRFKN